MNTQFLTNNVVFRQPFKSFLIDENNKRLVKLKQPLNDDTNISKEEIKESLADLFNDIKNTGTLS